MKFLNKKNVTIALIALGVSLGVNYARNRNKIPAAIS